MGYQVENNCFESREAAENYYFSLVIPVITQEGKLIQPSYNKNLKKWQMGDKIVEAYIPECDSVQNFKTGMEIGWLVFAIMGSLYAVHLIKGLLR
ncbi:hypothetical protein QEO94_07600 [Kingella negevensis]|uniref:hypothetical protein n=1 Tax=Kingella negevensis TaxID=1522312 RepID=UPI002543C047|nr:hypothetical protein [Kingella negevensis]WII92506.1 hypothetical protein QEO94_07600 [Kingella negevensis]